VELVPTSINVHSELVVTITEVLAQMWRGFDSTIVPCILPMLPIILVDAPTIVASIQVGDL
jgi:cytochrome c biogenesis protein CcdA